MSSRAPRRAIALLATTLVLGGCVGPLASATPVPAASDSRTETRTVDPFTAVTVVGRLNLVVATGTGVAVQVQAPSNILPLVRTTVAGGDLEVAVADPGYTSVRPVTIRITSPSVTSISLEGGAQAEAEVMAQSLTVSVAGGSVLRGIGTVQQLTVTVLGNSDAQLGDLTTDTAAISAAGGAKATLHVVKQLTGTADGGSVITLLTQPVAQSVTVTGGAEIVGP